MKDFKLKFIMVIFSLTTCFLSFSQEKIYYDKDWKGCSQNNAEYFRLYSIGSDGKPKGEIKDFFISGELQAVIEGAILINKTDDSQSKFIGLSVAYYKSGLKHNESLRDNYGNMLNYKSWYENGKLYRQFKYSDGKLIDKSFIECDEFGACQKIFYDNFSNKENINKWFLGSNEYGNCSFSNPKGYLINSKTVNGANSFIKIPLNLKDNFTIETTVEFKSGVKNKGHGLVWGLKDWGNYFYFLISANGYYTVGLSKEGISLVSKEWTFSSVINKNYSRNSLKILRNKDKMYFAINGNVIHSEDFYSMKSYNTGFLFYGKKEVIFEI